MRSNNEPNSFYKINTEDDNALIEAVKSNDIKTAGELLENGADPLIYDVIEVERREEPSGLKKKFTAGYSEKNYVTISFDAPLLFLSKSNKMKNLLYSYIRKTDLAGDENIIDMGHLHAFLLSQMSPLSRGLLVSRIIEKLPYRFYNDPAQGYILQSELESLKSFLVNLIDFLDVGSNTIDNIEINHSILYFMSEANKYDVDGSDIEKLLFQASTDLQQRSFFCDSTKAYSPLTYILVGYGSYILQKKDITSYESYLKTVLDNNYICWNDVKNKNIDLSAIVNSPYEKDKEEYAAGLTGMYALLDNLAYTTYFKLLNTCQLIYLVSKDLVTPMSRPAFPKFLGYSSPL